MDPIEILVDEHKLIKRGLTILETAASRIGDDPENAAPHFESLVDFIRTFADACHHAKEEDTLFVEMERRGIPREGGPIGAMLHDHTIGREFVGKMKDAADAVASGDHSQVPIVVENARGYVSLLREHIDKEDNVLYMIARQVMSPEELDALAPVFKEREVAKVGEGAHEKYTAIIEDLEKIF